MRYIRFLLVTHKFILEWHTLYSSCFNTYWVHFPRTDIKYVFSRHISKANILWCYPVSIESKLDTHIVGRDTATRGRQLSISFSSRWSAKPTLSPTTSNTGLLPQDEGHISVLICNVCTVKVDGIWQLQLTLAAANYTLWIQLLVWLVQIWLHW